MKVMVVADGTLKGIRKVNNDCHLIAMIKRLKNDANVSKVLIVYDPVVKGDKDYDIEVELITWRNLAMWLTLFFIFKHMCI